MALQPGTGQFVGVGQSKEGRPPQPKVELVADKWHAKAGWLGAPWTEAQMTAMVARLIGEDGSELIRCPLRYDAELSDRANKTWRYAKLLCRGS